MVLSFMRILSGIKKIIKNPYCIIFALSSFRLLNWMPDKMFIRLRYRAHMRKRLNLKKPVLFSEKLQWLKLYNRNPEHSRIVDKYEARGYIGERVGEDLLIPLLGVWDRFDDIDFSKLPDQFVLKCTHDSGGLVFCRDKSTFDFSAAKKKLEKCLKQNYYWFDREYPYKYLKSRIICEQFMVDERGLELKDYKVYCLNGTPRFIQVSFNRSTEHTISFFDMEWNLIPLKLMGYVSKHPMTISKPRQFDEMIELSKIFSKEHAFLRVDFYCIYDKLYIGELTFFPAAGFMNFDPPEYDSLLGNLLDLPSNNNNE